VGVSGGEGDAQVRGSESAAGLLAAGAVLPPGTEGAGERAVPLTARAYRHPGLDGRLVVRVVPAELGVAEDAANGFLGLEPAAEPAVVGVGLRQSLGFPEWVLVHYPQDGHHALGLAPELERAARRAETKPSAALDAYKEIAGRLAAAVPHFLPTFYEQAGRVFLSVENQMYARQMFGRARIAEAEHGLPVDAERLDAVFLEFALAGALTVKALTDYGKLLATLLPAGEALDRFSKLCLRRTAGGLAPSSPMTAQVRKMAKAAGADADAVVAELLAELLGFPATMHSSAGWWKTHRAALVSLARQKPTVRRALLDTMPTDTGATALWLDVLIDSGAAAGLFAPEVPLGLRPSDGTAGWLRRFQRMRGPSGRWSSADRVPRLYQLVEQCAQRLREELSGAAAPLAVPDDIDLLDLLLALRVPVADPDRSCTLILRKWSQGEGQRDLVALAADARFRDAFDRGAESLTNNNNDSPRGIRVLAGSVGGRPMLAQWVRNVAQQVSVVGLPSVPAALRRLSQVPGEALALAEPEARAAAATDLAPVLARTLRAGLFDELTWPAWEQAAAELVAPQRIEDLRFADAWPYLIVAGPTQVRVIDAEGTVLTHDLRVPKPPQRIGFHYVDSELLVYWEADDETRGYWHGSADQIRTIGTTGARAFHSMRIYGYRYEPHTSLPLPAGGRTTGRGIIHRGDSAVPEDGPLIGDGVSFWARTSGRDNDQIWHEYDPVSGRSERESMPAFFTDTLRSAPEGSIYHSGVLLHSAPEGGLLGFCVVKLPDGSMRLRTVSGLEVSVPRGIGHDPVGALVMPEDDRPRALVRDGYHVSMVDADGVVTMDAMLDERAGTFGRTSAALPPLSFWHHLRPRDPQGSAALRRIDDSHAALLLKAGAERLAADPKQERLPEIVRELLPEVTDSALIAGICKVVGFAVKQRAELDKVAARLDKDLAVGRRDEEGEPVGPQDRLLFEPLRSLGGRRDSGGLDKNGSFRQILLIEEAVRGLAAGEAWAPARLHLDGPALPPSGAVWWTPMLGGCSALAVRAASAGTAPQTADALRELLRVFDAAGLAAPADRTMWRCVTLHVPKSPLTTTDGNRRPGSWQGLLGADGGRLIAVVHWAAADNGYLFTALYHDPSGRFDVPEPYTLHSSVPVGEQREPGWLAAFLEEWDKRGPAPWIPEAAERFAELTGASATEARLILAGLPGVTKDDGSALSAEARKTIKVKAAEAIVARERLNRVEPETLRAIVAALLPADPARLWTEGPAVAAAAEVWNRLVQPSATVPEALMVEASRAVQSGWGPSVSVPALLDPGSSPQLSRDLVWKVSSSSAAPVDSNAVGFTAKTLTGAVALSAWLAHRLPAGDPIRAALPAALDALRARLSNPGLLLGVGGHVILADFRKAAGAPTEVSEGFERYGAVVIPTNHSRHYSVPILSVAHLDAVGGDPYLPLLRGEAQRPFPVEVALGLALDPGFAALLADPGDPIAGERGIDGTWFPQDPSRSVPDLVAEVARGRSLSSDAAALYLMLLAMPDPTDRVTRRWTGWKPARMAAARAELAATDLVVEASRTRAGRSLFLPGAWTALHTPYTPLETWKTQLYGGLLSGVLGVVAPVEPAERLYRRAWQRVVDGDGPRFAEFRASRSSPRRR
jgi:hypothetical protein